MDNAQTKYVLSKSQNSLSFLGLYYHLMYDQTRLNLLEY